MKNAYKSKVKKDSNFLIKHYWNIIRMISTWEEHYPEQLIILDRFYPSQAVYSYLRGIDEMENLDIKNLDMYCNQLCVKMIYLDTPLKDLKDRFKSRGDEHVKEDMLDNIKTRYDVFLGLTKLEVLKLDTRQEDWLKKVEEFIKC